MYTIKSHTACVLLLAATAQINRDSFKEATMLANYDYDKVLSKSGTWKSGTNWAITFTYSADFSVGYQAEFLTIVQNDDDIFVFNPMGFIQGGGNIDFTFTSPYFILDLIVDLMPAKLTPLDL